ncbi:helix-turn-helix transcriptional regulator [Amycolatopsis thermophila]|uniref:ArsR family transcriptional regulator n=1 Tax=Amycolatopsis thermophila TaxID=206084 RepID=A0ABU0F0U0_9PSEU|nr:helix-turn-helix domain-containing protein [Amycolatopsis thermophila]MDQ0381177.1 putative ArsR family transcriptional regulator [Amycolatopsis thermophila]
MDDAVSAVAALEEPTRRRLYDYVVRQPDPVGRDEVAAATGLPRATVAFHLDKLVAEQLLDVGFERRTGRSGPGAGRPAKLYRRSGRQVTVSLPERRYELAGTLLAGALEEADRTGGPPGPILRRRARELGEQLGRTAVGVPVESIFEEYGFEPRTGPGGTVFANCPFHRLAQEHTELVCGMNLSFAEGLLAGLRCADLSARLEPLPGACCVRLRPGVPS